MLAVLSVADEGSLAREITNRSSAERGRRRISFTLADGDLSRSSAVAAVFEVGGEVSAGSGDGVRRRWRTRDHRRRVRGLCELRRRSASSFGLSCVVSSAREGRGRDVAMYCSSEGSEVQISFCWSGAER